MSRHKRRRQPQRVAPSPPPVRAPASRIRSVDALRGAAICAMIVYHFAFDLNWFGVFTADFNHDLLWLAMRAAIVGSFLLLVGISLVLARRSGTTPERFWRRIALIAVCAALVTLGSYVTFPRSFITFGILHCIAISSILAWPLVRYPHAALIVGLVVVAVGVQVHNAIFDAPWLNWVGLMTFKPATEDYVPLFPWFGVVCIGVALGAWLSTRGYAPLRPVARVAPAWLNWLGRHSLLVYMIHQPVLLGVLRIVVSR
jgi:uncharacterized membrane protein